MRAGKHVLVEKPLARDERQPDRIIEEAQRANGWIDVRAGAAFSAALPCGCGKSAASRSYGFAMFTRKCGTPSWSPWLTDDARSGGAVLDLLIHDVDFCSDCSGPNR